MKKIIAFLLGFPALAWAQYHDTSQVLNQIYGPITTGCIQTAVTTSGNNRSAALTIGRRYILYGYSGTSSTDMATVAIKCVQGTSTVDVTAIGGSRVGVIIFPGQQMIIKVQDANSQYVSCISAAATQKYDLCALP